MFSEGRNNGGTNMSTYYDSCNIDERPPYLELMNHNIFIIGGNEK